MFSIRAVGVVLAGSLLMGCHSGNVSGPNASTQMPTDQQTAAGLLRSWEATHPGSHAGVVDAVLPARRLASVTDPPTTCRPIMRRPPRIQRLRITPPRPQLSPQAPPELPRRAPEPRLRLTRARPATRGPPPGRSNPRRPI